MSDSSPLPDDINALKAMLAERDAALSASRETIQALREELSSRSIEIEQLKLLIAKLKRMQFGRKSEKLDRQIEQLETRLEDLQTEDGEALADPSDKPLKQRAARKTLPEHLPRDEKIYMPSHADCPECHGTLKALGEDVSEQLEWTPGSFRVIRHVRPRLACSGCDKIVQVDAPSRPIARGIAAPGLLAHILVAKYADHLPLYRQSVIYAREGVELSRSFLADQVGAASALLRPLVDAVRRHVFAATKLHADDTPISVLAPGNGKTKTARLWTYVRDDQPAGSTDPAAVWFAYTPDRKGIHPQTHLASFTGTLQADAYAGFNAVYESGRIQEAACWAHARRKFYDLHKARPSAITAEALKRIGELYKIEEAIRGQQPEERRRIRQEQSAPLIDDIERWFQEVLPTLSRKSDTTAAINYALNLWPALRRYSSEGNIEIDNSAAERSLRSIALGRKNYLFAGADSGGERAAAIYSLIGTARLNNIDPERWLRHVLARIADHPVNRMNELLPWNVVLD